MKRYIAVFVMLTAMLLLCVGAACADADWNRPVQTIHSSGNRGCKKGTKVDQSLINCVVRVTDSVGGWFRMKAPVDGDYTFTVLNGSISPDSMSIVLHLERDGSCIEGQTWLEYPRSSSLQSQVFRDVKAGDEIHWWNAKNRSGKTLQSDFLMMISVDGYTVSAPEPVDGEFFLFGTFEQDYFDVDGKEPIVWRELARQDGLVLAVSEYGLYTMKYHRNNKTRSWGDTDVRDWLNTDFLAAFTAEEKAMIVPASVSGSTDTAFLLNAEQVTEYLQYPYLCYATPYALMKGEKGAYVNEDTGASSWLVRGDVCKKRIYWVGGGGKLYTPDGKKGVNYQTSADNVVRPAIWVREEATANRVTEFGFGLYAKTLMKISTRSGPTTGYNGIGDYFSGGGQLVRVISRVHDGSIWWLQVEFEYKGAMVRCYTGLKRVDISIARVPDEVYSDIGTVVVREGAVAYYGPGTYYKKQTDKYTPAGGTQARVIFEENGWYCVEYASAKEQIRVWLRSEDTTAP